MANQEQQNQSGAAPAAPTLPPRSLARRRFARAGLAVSGSLLTVANATGVTAHACATPSGSLSGGLHSRAPEAPPELCGGLSPGGWKSDAGADDTWPVPKNTLFSALYGCTGIQGSRYAGKTLIQVLNPQTFQNVPGKDPGGIGRHMVAAWLNFKSGKVNVLDDVTLKKMWNEYLGDGTYSPAAGVNWDACTIVRYIVEHTFHGGVGDPGEECGV